MAINPSTQYPGRVTAPDTNYPYGSGKNDAVPGDKTGTPFDKAFGDDIWGFFQALLQNATLEPSGTPETAQASQYLQAIQYEITSMPVYATNAAALAGGLAVGKRYKTATGQIYVVVADGSERANALLDLSDGKLLASMQRVMTGATDVDAGTAGVVPAPAAGDEGKFLAGDGTWQAAPRGAETPSFGSFIGVVALGDSQDGYFDGATTAFTQYGFTGVWDSVSNAINNTTYATAIAGLLTTIDAKFTATEMDCIFGDVTGSGNNDQENFRVMRLVIDWENEQVIGSLSSHRGADDNALASYGLSAERVATIDEFTFVKVGGNDSQYELPKVRVDWINRTVDRLPLVNDSGDAYAIHVKFDITHR